MIRINLIDYNKIVRQVVIQKQLTTSVSVIFAFIAICGVNWVFETASIANLKDDVREIEVEVAQLDPKYKKVQRLKKQESKLNKIITGIDQLRTKRSRTTEILDDVGQSIPEDIWLKTIDQLTSKEVKAKRIPFVFLENKKSKPIDPKSKNQASGDDQFIEIKGLGKSDQSVVNFLDQLKGVPYLDHVLLFSTKEIWIGLNPIREFTIYCHVMKSDVQA